VLIMLYEYDAECFYDSILNKNQNQRNHLELGSDWDMYEGTNKRLGLILRSLARMR
jgi:hypothetical protein